MKKTHIIRYLFLLVLPSVFQNTSWTLSVGCFSVSWEKRDWHSASCLCQEECDIHGGGRVFLPMYGSTWGCFYTAVPRLLLSSCSQKRDDSCPTAPQYFQRLFAWLFARVYHPLPWCPSPSQGWSSERLGNRELSLGQGQPRHPWDTIQPAKCYWKAIFTHLLHIWKLLKVCAFLTSSFCPLSPAKI